MTSRLAGYGHRAPRIARRRAIVFSVLLGITMILMIASATAPVAEVQRGLAFALSPFAEAVNGVGREVRSVVDAAAEIDRLRRENATLRADNDRLEQRNRTLEALATENEQLTALLAIRNSLDYSTVAARVISRELADVSRVVMIDAGSEDGLAIGDVVVGAGGALVGRVTELGASAARVTLINDPASTVIGEIVGSRATGEVVGDLGGTLVMDKIDATQQITIGEEVVTAGSDARRGGPLAVPEGPRDRPDHRRHPRPERGRPDRLRRAGDRPDPAGGAPRHHRLQGRDPRWRHPAHRQPQPRRHAPRLRAAVRDARPHAAPHAPPDAGPHPAPDAAALTRVPAATIAGP